jgi:hypothetical protein
VLAGRRKEVFEERREFIGMHVQVVRSDPDASPPMCPSLLPVVSFFHPLLIQMRLLQLAMMHSASHPSLLPLLPHLFFFFAPDLVLCSSLLYILVPRMLPIYSLGMELHEKEKSISSLSRFDQKTFWYQMVLRF